MKPVKYILINETNTQNVRRALRDSHLPNIRHNIIVDYCDRQTLIQQLMYLRRLYPDAKILGISELNGNGIRPNDMMNKLRRELSDLP